jgi:hypothetical protein
MNTQQTHKLTPRPFIRTSEGSIHSIDAPVSVYFVDGMPNDLVAQLRNKRAHGREPLWTINYVHLDAEVGEYMTAEEALAALQGFVDEPTVLFDALHWAKTEWVSKWGHVADHQFAKVAHRDVEAWERIVKAHSI